tara:strand:+ start:2150 stop:3673 length:1524 start_codon:yes stop_codon:yes gene_type:complete
MMQKKPFGEKHIIILGGGTAGWMAASLFDQAWGADGARITLIESAEIDTIGVGEGSTPYLRQFFRTLNIPENEWMPACNATYKCGIRFPGWSGKPGFESYFHPFFSELDQDTGYAFFHNCALRRGGIDVPVNPDRFFVSAQLAAQHKSPVAGEGLRHTPDYGYHFDAGLLGAFLKKRAKARGINHRIDTVERVAQDESGDITALHLKDGGSVDGDLFIDCTGFAALLIQKSLGERFVSYGNVLFNDRAVALASPLNPAEGLPSETVSTALGHGWAWKIPLTTRFGNGYVYSSAHIDESAAEDALRRHLGPAAKEGEARHLKMRVGRVENHWQKNCLAVGLSQGFIEPLEATALMLVQLTIEKFIQMYGEGDYTPRHQPAFNQRINMFFDGIRDYIVTHYKINSRSDSDYWIENRGNPHISDRLAELLAVWEGGGDFETLLDRYGDALIYLRPSWYAILAGMGRFPSHATSAPMKTPIAPMHQIRDLHAEALAYFPDHRDQLARMYPF